MFCPPLSTPPATARGEACSLMRASFIDVSSDDGRFQSVGVSAVARAGGRGAEATHVLRPEHPMCPFVSTLGRNACRRMHCTYDAVAFPVCIGTNAVAFPVSTSGM